MPEYETRAPNLKPLPVINRRAMQEMADRVESRLEAYGQSGSPHFLLSAIREQQAMVAALCHEVDSLRAQA